MSLSLSDQSNPQEHDIGVGVASYGYKQSLEHDARHDRFAPKTGPPGREVCFPKFDGCC